MSDALKNTFPHSLPFSLFSGPYFWLGFCTILLGLIRPSFSLEPHDGDPLLVPAADFREINARSILYATSFGTLAYLPKADSHDAALDAGQFRVLPKRSLCRLRAQQDNLWFQFNHRANDNGGKPRHLGVLIITESAGDDIVKSEFARNKGWQRAGNNGAELEALSRPSEKSWEEFDAFMRQAHTIEDTDRIIGGTWHATPIDGENPSFTYERFWPSLAFRRTKVAFASPHDSWLMP